MGIWDFFTPDAGQKRRQWLNQNMNAPVDEAMRYYLGAGNSVPQIAGLLAEGSPVASIDRAGTSFQDIYAPDRTGWQRAEAVGNTLTDMTGAGLGLLGAPAASKVGADLLTDVATRVSKNANVQKTIGQSAAEAYMIGGRLQKDTRFVGAGGKPNSVSIPDKGEFSAKPVSEIESAAVSYMKQRGMDTTAFEKYPPFSEERAQLIAAAYDMMKHTPKNKSVKAAYEAMIQETLDQYKALKDNGIDFKFLTEGMPDPYSKSPAMGYQDLVENGRLWVFPTDFGFGTSTKFDAGTNPLLKSVGRIGDKPNAVANDAFRAVHDAFGHFGSGNPFFRHKGEERAFLEHSRMYSPEARGAMTSETRGQNSWLNFGPHGSANQKAATENTIFADQKSGLLPSWAHSPQGMPNENEMFGLLGQIEKWKR